MSGLFSFVIFSEAKLPTSLMLHQGGEVLPQTITNRVFIRIQRNLDQKKILLESGTTNFEFRFLSENLN